MFKHLIAVGMALILAIPVLASEPVTGRAGRAEVRFLEGMIDHHQMALDMANDCLVKETGEELETLCRNVIEAQSAEIEQMQGWLLDWYQIEYTPMSMLMPATESESDAHSGHGGHTMPQTVTDAAGMMGMMAGFNRLNGVAYEIAWLESMVDHHDDALHMAKRVLLRAEHPELIDLANTIIAAQSAEIAQMENMITERGE